MSSFQQALRALPLPRAARSPLMLCALVAALALLGFFVFTVLDGVERGTALRQSQRQQDRARVEQADQNTPNRRVQAAEQDAAAAGRMRQR
jgi:hypothetical protein